MGFDDRLTYLLLGGLIGFILGRLTSLDRKVLTIKEELDEVDEIVKRNVKRNERGAIGISVKNVWMFIILTLVAYAAISSQISSNKTNHTAAIAAKNADDLARVVHCNHKTLNDTLKALGERTTYTTDAQKKSIQLAEAQHLFLNTLLHRPPPPANKAFKAAENYNSDNQSYIVISKKSLHKVLTNPIPSARTFTQCVQQSK